MDFGALYELSVPRPWDDRSEYNAYWNALTQVVEAERQGFSHVWAVEHHFLEEFSHSSAPEVWLSAVAQHTSTIRIGHGVVLVPAGFNHPVRVAERVAALDILSNGRVEFGTGRSITNEELGGFGIASEDSRPQWREAVDLIPKLWMAEGPVTYNGDYTQVHDRSMCPKPLQKPHPPMWLACTSPSSYALAGELGLGVLAFGMAVSPDAMARRIADYRQALANAEPATGVVNDKVGVFLLAHCAPTPEEARQVAEASFISYLDQTMQYFLGWGRGEDLPPGYEWYAEVSQNKEEMAKRLKFDFLVENHMMACGSPEDMSKTIQMYKDAGADQIIMGMAVGRIPHENVLSNLKLIGKEVIPLFT
jgi:alkanesulfonate monooxygenase SsuD/methylene tetrahydromethanopterin reductase-like flavin-dependent oxidoreductase (luciferase family)